MTRFGVNMTDFHNHDDEKWVGKVREDDIKEVVNPFSYSSRGSSFTSLNKIHMV